MNDCEYVRTPFYPLSVSIAEASDPPCHYTLALECARRAGVPQQLREDCAQDFLLHLFTRCSRAEPQQESEHATVYTHAWLRRSAHNHAIDFLRHHAVIRRYEVEMPEEETESSPFVSPQPTPESQLLAGECRQRIQEAVTCLTPSQQDLFTRLIVNDASAGEVAERTGRTAHAIRQVDSTLCKQLRQIFARRGITEEYLREYISITQNGGG